MSKVSALCASEEWYAKSCYFLGVRKIIYFFEDQHLTGSEGLRGKVGQVRWLYSKKGENSKENFDSPCKRVKVSIPCEQFNGSQKHQQLQMDNTLTRSSGRQGGQRSPNLATQLQAVRCTCSSDDRFSSCSNKSARSLLSSLDTCRYQHKVESCSFALWRYHKPGPVRKTVSNDRNRPSRPSISGERRPCWAWL